MALQEIFHSQAFAGQVYYYQHASNTCQCDMTFSVYLPPQAEKQSVPAIYWLSGLTCNHENFITKAGAQYFAAKYGVALIMPDTSPRQLTIAGAEQAYAAGFYVNATQAPFSQHFQMFDYVVNELPKLCETELPIMPNQRSIMGHSMGGHGALVIALTQPKNYRSVSAFAPICHPMLAPWGEQYFKQYLGADKQQWRAYDACELIKTAVKKIPLLVDQGSDDPFLQNQLMPEALVAVCDTYQHPLELRYQAGYDHSYYFIASFIGGHMAYHAKHLK